jgi:hypothetical protein
METVGPHHISATRYSTSKHPTAPSNACWRHKAEKAACLLKVFKSPEEEEEEEEEEEAAMIGELFALRVEKARTPSQAGTAAKQDQATTQARAPPPPPPPLLLPR